MRRALLVLVALALLSAARAGRPPQPRPARLRAAGRRRRSSTRSGRPPPPSAPATVASSTAPSPARRCVAVADGRVTFAGPVAGTLHVTVLHDDGIRTTYSFLDASTWWSGSGSAGRPGRHHRRPPPPRGAARRRYFDPAVALRRRPPRFTSCPSTTRPATGEAGERSAIGQLIGGAGALLERGSAVAAGAVGGWLRERRARSCCARSTTTLSAVHLPRLVHRRWCHDAPGLAAGPMRRRPAPARRPAPRCRRRPERRVAVLVAGLGSHSGGSTVDQVAHRRARVRAGGRRSASATPGGRVPDPTDGFARSRPPPTERAETQADLGPRVSGWPTSSRRSARRRRASRSTCRPLPGRCRRPAGADRARATPRHRVARAPGAARHARLAARRRRPGHRRPCLVEHEPR